MPETMTKPPAASLDADDIIAYLRQHPHFLQQHPEAVDLLHPPREQSQGKGVVDFQYYMVQRLRADRDEVISSTREIVETSRHNMNNQTRFHNAVLLLLDARNFEEFVRTMTIDFAALMNVDIVSLIVETDGDQIPHIDITGVRAARTGTIDALMNNRAVQLQGDIAGIDVLYGGGATLVKSQALLRIEAASGSPPVLLAFGSRAPDMFQEGQGTELLAFLGHVIERCFRAWLDIE